MSNEMERFLCLKMVPARLNAEQAGWLLGFSVHEIPILAAKGLLKPLGHPAHNSPKYFLAADVDELRQDRKWFAKASDAITDHWRLKNRNKVIKPANGIPARSVPTR